jgi:Family of unknown function (DUF5709)
MTSRIPEPASGFEAEGIPDPGESTAAQEASGGDLSGQEPPRDTQVAVGDFGTTAAEQHDGEPLDGRIEREEPDVLDAAALDADESQGADTPFDERAGQGVGRIVEPDQGARGDTEADLVATDVGTDLGGYSAEEQAMHVEPDV